MSIKLEAISTKLEAISRVLYSIAWYLATPLVMLHLWSRSRRQPEYRQHWRQRWAIGLSGQSGQSADSMQPPIWIHAVSVGETRAAQPLIDALRQHYPLARILLTCMTPTGRETGQQLFGDRVVQSYLPYDYPGAIDRFIAAWQPAIAIIMETELWPNLVARCDHHQIAVCLVNARLSPRSLRKGLRWSMLITPALRQLRVIAAQTQADAARLTQLGGRQIVVTGNIKFDITPAPDAVAIGKAWRLRLGRRSVVVAASTRDGEERALLKAWRSAQPSAAGLAPLLLIVPRHPQRFDDVCSMAQAEGFVVQRRSVVLAGTSSDPAELARIDVLIGDSMGEMFAYYELADVAVLGGSLLPYGGQNLIEPCAVGTPVIVGPHTFNFDEAAEQAILHGAAVRADDASAAVRLALQLLADPTKRAAMAHSALDFGATHRGATDKTMAAIEPLLVVALRQPPAA